MKNNFTLLFFFLSITGFSQSMESLKTETDKMYEASYNLDFETILDLTYPRFFQLTSRDAMLNTMEEYYRNKTSKIRFVYPTMHFTYSDIKTIDDRKFCVIKYKCGMRVTYMQKLTPETADRILTSMRKNSNTFSTVFEEDKNSFFYTGDAILIAVSDSLTKGEWRFINYDDVRVFELLFGKNYKTDLGL